MIEPRYVSVPITGSKSPLTGEIDAAMEAVRTQMRACSSQHPIFIAYRPYRRGRNRCRFCGCRLEGRR